MRLRKQFFADFAFVTNRNQLAPFGGRALFVNAARLEVVAGAIVAKDFFKVRFLELANSDLNRPSLWASVKRGVSEPAAFCTNFIPVGIYVQKPPVEPGFDVFQEAFFGKFAFAVRNIQLPNKGPVLVKINGSAFVCCTVQLNSGFPVVLICNFGVFGQVQFDLLVVGHSNAPPARAGKTAIAPLVYSTCYSTFLGSIRTGGETHTEKTHDHKKHAHQRGRPYPRTSKCPESRQKSWQAKRADRGQEVLTRPARSYHAMRGGAVCLHNLDNSEGSA